MSVPLALPRWADLVLLPAVCLAVALAVAAGVVALVGQSPPEVMVALVHGAFGTLRGLSYTLYYATTFIFTGLAVAVAFHGGLFFVLLYYFSYWRIRIELRLTSSQGF